MAQKSNALTHSQNPPTAAPAIDPAYSLFGTKQKPQDLVRLQRDAERAWAYHCLNPYPRFAYTSWKTEDLGPLPRCRAVPRRAVKRGARFLFGKGIEIRCAGNEALETFLRDAWTANKMPARAVAMAERGAVEGGVCLKFSYDPDAIPQLSIQTLSLVSQVRLYYHPHNRSRLLMARVQYSYYDAADGKTKWYREEWSDLNLVVYLPVDDEKIGRTGDPDTYENWFKDEALSGPNPFRVIPVVPIKNIETDDLYGTGDLWELWGLIDDLNLVWYQMKRSNQFDSELNPWLIDAEVDDEDIDKPVKPGQPMDIKSSSSDSSKQAKVVFPDGGNGLRTSMMDYAKELRREIEEATGTVSVDSDSVTNKGNLTQAVLHQLYQVLLETNAEKQKSYGQNGIEPFLEAVAKGLAYHKVPGLGVTDNPDTWNVEVNWPASFELTNEEKLAVVGRIQEEEVAGYTTHDRAVETIAQLEGVHDVKALKEELAKEPKPTPTEDLDPLTGKPVKPIKKTEGGKNDE